MSAEKFPQPLFVAKGIRDYVETGSTGTNLVSYGVSICGAGTYTLSAPNYLGANKRLILTSSDAVVQTESSGTVFQGTTFNQIAATTALDSPVVIDLIGASTAAWYLNSQANSTVGTYAVAAATM